MTSSFQSRLGTAPEEAIKAPCRAATTANITLSGEQTIDGVSVVAGDRVFVKNQTTGSENGIYVCQTSSWTRATDWNGAGDVVSGMLIPVTSGTVSANIIYIISFSGTFTVGTSTFTVVQAIGVEANAANVTFNEDSGDVSVESALSNRTSNVSSLAALQAVDISSFSGGETRYMEGRFTVGDGGEGTFIWRTGDKSTEVTADEVTGSGGNGGIWIAPTIDLTGASGALERIEYNFISPEFYGAAADNSTDDSAAIIDALTSGPTILTEGKTYYTNNLTVPDNSILYLNGADLRGGIQIGDGADIIGPGTISSNEGDARPMTISAAKNLYAHSVDFLYRGTTGVSAVVYGQPNTFTIENIVLDECEISCSNPTADANTRGFKILNQSVNTGLCRNVFVNGLHVHDTPSMGIEIVSEWGGFPSDYGDITAYGHYNVIFTRPLIDNCGQTVGSQSKIGLSFAGTGQAVCRDAVFRNANGKNWEFVSQLGSEMIDCTIEDTASGFDVFSTSAPGGAPTAVNYKCKINGVRVVDGNAQLLNILGFEYGQITGIEATNVQRMEAGCYFCDVWRNNIEASGTIGMRVSGGENRIYENRIDILAIGASGNAALRFNGTGSTDNMAWDNTLVHNSSVTAWDEASSAADNVVKSYFDADNEFYGVNYMVFQMAADADENLSKQVQYANIVRVTDAVTLTATRNLTLTISKNVDMVVMNATGSGQSIVVKYATGSGATIADGDVAHIVGNTGTVWRVA